MVIGSSDIETYDLQSLLPGILAPATQPRPGSMRRDCTTVVCFSCGKAGHSATRCPDFSETFPFMLPGWKAEKVGGGYIMIPPVWQRNVVGRETTTDPGRGVSHPDQ